MNRGERTMLDDRTRLSIVTLLATSADAWLSFTEIQEKAELTPGNLSSHLRSLEEAGYVQVIKQFRGRRPLTTVRITDAGKAALERHIEEMEELIRRYRDGPSL